MLAVLAVPMMPWSHLFVAVVPVILYVALRHRQLPSALLIVAVATGSQFPDLVDKPLAWGADVLINGRMFMHSLVFAIPVSTVVILTAITFGNISLGSGFVSGYLLHIAGDFYTAFVGPAQYIPSNMLWPLLPPRPITEPEFVAHPSMIRLSMVDGIVICTTIVFFAYICFSLSATVFSETPQ